MTEMRSLVAPAPTAPAARREYVLKVVRASRAPAPWAWEIHAAVHPEPVLLRSAARYRSADEAWAAGLPALDAVRRVSRRGAQR
jgi:hypothetical protein